MGAWRHDKRTASGLRVGDLGPVLAILAGVCVVAVSLAYFIAGIAEQNAMSQTYVVGFVAAGEDMVDLSETLGDDGPGLSAADQREIQDLVDTYAATVPESKRPTYDEGFFSFGLHGATLAVTGGGVALLALAGGLGALRTLRRT